MAFSDSDSPKFGFNVADVSGGVNTTDFRTTDVAVLVVTT